MVISSPLHLKSPVDLVPEARLARTLAEVYLVAAQRAR